jgi:biopolymer transport protein ExbD
MIFIVLKLFSVLTRIHVTGVLKHLPAADRNKSETENPQKVVIDVRRRVVFCFLHFGLLTNVRHKLSAATAIKNLIVYRGDHSV